MTVVLLVLLGCMLAVAFSFLGFAIAQGRRTNAVPQRSAASALPERSRAPLAWDQVLPPIHTPLSAFGTIGVLEFDTLKSVEPVTGTWIRVGDSISNLAPPRVTLTTTYLLLSGSDIWWGLSSPLKSVNVKLKDLDDVLGLYRPEVGSRGSAA